MPRPGYLSLANGCSLRLLEEPCLYQRERDELYELNQEAWDFMLECAAGRALEGDGDVDLVQFCLAEGLLALTPLPEPVAVPAGPSPRPSLRYLELQLTRRCNLRCGHCYLGPARKSDLPLDLVLAIIKQFNHLQGLQVLLSGGEPLLNPWFWQLNDLLPSLGIGSVLLTNATLFDEEAVARLKVDQVQVSLDGLREGHDTLRGRGTFDLAWRGLETLLAAGRSVTVATMAHRANLQELEGLGYLLDSWGIDEWEVDVPVNLGNMAHNPSLTLTPSEAATALELSRSAGHYSAAEQNLACGAHLATVTPEGYLLKCGYYNPGPDTPILNRVPLLEAWQSLPRLSLDALSCQCAFRQECRGGCRFRAEQAGDAWGPDPVQCHRFGVAGLG